MIPVDRFCRDAHPMDSNVPIAANMRLSNRRVLRKSRRPA
jgi:hypothetical protein